MKGLRIIGGAINQIAKETLIKTRSPRSNAEARAADRVTLRFNQRVPKKANETHSVCANDVEQPKQRRKQYVSD